MASIFRTTKDARMPDEATYTADQVATAARELRQAAGTDEERFTSAQVISMLRDEIRLLRERGFNDAQIASLLTGFDICVSPEDVARHSVVPKLAE